MTAAQFPAGMGRSAWSLEFCITRVGGLSFLAGPSGRAGSMGSFWAPTLAGLAILGSWWRPGVATGRKP
jgi:hypothetical protein